MMNKTMVLAAALCASAAAWAAVADLEREFDAAVRDGKPLAAESAFKKLIAEKPDTAPIRYFQAAEMARRAGRESLRRDRLAYFLRAEKGWSGEVEQALSYLCRTEGSAERFARLAKHLPHDAALFKSGIALMDRLLSDKRQDEVVKLADVMFTSFASVEQRNEVVNRCRNAVTEALPAFIMKYDLSKCPGFNDLMYQGRERFNAAWIVDYCTRHGCVASALVDRGWDLNNGYWNTGSRQKERAEVCKKFGALAPKVLAAGTPVRLQLDYVRVAARNAYLVCPGAAKDAKTNKWRTPKLAEWLKAIPCDRKAKGFDPNQWSAAVNDVINAGTLTDAEIAGIVAKFPQAAGGWRAVCSGPSGNLVEAARKSKSAVQLANFINQCEKSGDWPRSEIVGMRNNAADVFSAYNDIDSLKAAFADTVRQSPNGFDWNRYRNIFAVCTIDDERKTAALKDVWAITGTTAPWKSFLEALLKDGEKADADWAKKVQQAKDQAAKQKKAYVEPKKPKPVYGQTASFRSFAKTALASDSMGAAPLMRCYRQMMKIPAPKKGAGCPAEAHKIAAEAVKAYAGKHPDYKAGFFDSNYFDAICERYYNCVNAGSADDRRKFFDTIIVKLAPSSRIWGWMWDLTHRVGEKDESQKNRYRLAKYAASGNVDEICRYYLDPKADKLPEGLDLGKFDQGQVYALIERNVNGRFSAPVRVQVFSAFFRAKPSETWKDDNQYGYVMDNWLSGSPFVTNRDIVASVNWNALYQRCIDGAHARTWLSRCAVRFAAANGHGEEALARYLQAASALDLQGRYTAVLDLFRLRSAKPGEWNTLLSRKEGLKIVKERLLPYLREIPDKMAPRFSLSDQSPYEVIRDFENGERGQKENERDKAAIGTVCEFWHEFERMISAGAYNSVNSYTLSHPLYRAYMDALATTNVNLMTRVANRTGGTWRGTVGESQMMAAINGTKEAGAWEPLYLLVNAAGSGDVGQSVASACARIRAEVVRKLPGIYPVSEKDPAYPLYVAADELARNNPEGAGKLLKAHMSVFEREAANLPPDFTAWAVDQIRIQRGAKDELVVKARQIATQVLANESKITPELAAAMLLVRAETFRDQQNFEAAKLEYQSIQNNPTYANTPSGKQAMFRSVALMIDTGNATGAEQLLEYWLSQPDASVQAQAHYFMARIAFERKDYEECIKQLKEVFAIDFTHTEARFLHGQWKLATNNEVDETEVLIGNLSDRTAVRPGQQLSITVQDRNLSVAGGGSSIPVIATTDPGGDRERIYLYPSARDANLFKGVIDVRLAPVVVSNLVLEASGRDTVSYVIDPEFLRARGLPVNAGKRLRVVDDARLAIGAGAPRTEESQSASQIAALVSDGTDAGGKALVQTLRPGNPLYVAVSDKDRSRGGERDTVAVTVETTSGDKISNVPLAEVKPYSGVFRGTIPTALPPPRAFASDTAVGFNPGDVINSGRKGQWKSLSDGKPGKFIAVDTMGSHVVSNVCLKLPAPGDVTSVRLVGSLGEDISVLGSLPSGDPVKRLGLKYQKTNGQKFRGEAAIRDFMESAKAPQYENAKELVFKPHWNNNNNAVRFSGVFAQPKKYDYLRFRFEPLERTGRVFSRLWVALAIDGKTVYTGMGPAIAESVCLADMTPGPHRLELFATGYSQKDDSFKLVWEPLGADPADVPAEWFDYEKHPEFKEFVADRAKIVRTSEGFQATFARPMRLRTVRWDFLGLKTPDVTVDEIRIENDAGEAVIPVASDFSDAQQNNTLEVAPGDRITVRYSDESTSSGARKVLEKTMNSSFNDATVGFYFEEMGRGSEQSKLHAAFRFVPGDKLLIAVKDPDLDQSEEADRIKVTVTTTSGQKRQVILLEQEKYGSYGESDGVHSGFFLGLLRTAAKGDPKAHAKALQVEENDKLEVSYEDRENTKPGVPCVRKASVQATSPTDPLLTLFHTRKIRVVDNSVDGRNRLAKIRSRPGNENVQCVFRDEVFAVPMTKAIVSQTNTPITVNVAAPLLVRVNDPSRARHEASKLKLEIVAESEIKRAEEAGEEPQCEVTYMRLGGSFGGVKLKKGDETPRVARMSGSFNGMAYFVVGAAETASEEVLHATGRLTGRPENEGDRPALVPVNGNDRVRIRVYAGDDVLVERTLDFAANASLALMDSTWKAERGSAHVGERFFVQVDDADLDQTAETDRIRIRVRSLASGNSRETVLTETLPHSGVFNGVVRPVMFAPGELVPSVVTGGVASTEMLISEDRFSVVYGDRLTFTYADERTLPGSPAKTLCVTGVVHKGANGSVRLFSKRFRDTDQAVLVQFRLAECLFEQAKEHRKLKQQDKSTEAIAKGKFILEEALKNHPDSSHAVQGEYLLANLYQELAMEQKEAKNDEGARRLFTEALSRFSSLLAIWPEGEYAARAQYHKALCLEMLGDFRRAGEEYVKMTYLYPESDLVGDATIRLATHYYKNEKRYDISARIYENFQKRFPNHAKAARALFMCGSCYVKEAEKLQAAAEAESQTQDSSRKLGAESGLMYQRAAKAFESLTEIYRTSTTPELRAQALYWAGDVSLRRADAKSAYIFLKRTVLEYPETEWARRARGLLLQEATTFKAMEDY